MNENIPSDRHYTEEHEWAAVDGDVVTVGITAHAVDQLGDITMVTLPKVATRVSAGDAVADVDSVKAVSQIYAPLGGEVIAVNDALDGAPETVNQDPYGGGWMFKIRLSDREELGKLLSPERYAALVAEG
ncbi:MAG: glycine cleavage system protein GcvH [Nannocystaceae bacterium]